jgi:hypothetical protein
MNHPRSGHIAIPTRQPTIDEALKRSGSLAKLLLGGSSRISPQLWRKLGEGYLHGDPPADALAEWMMSDPRRNRPLFERALHQGIASVNDAPQELREFFSRYERRPEWLDEELLAEGVRISQIGGTTAFYVLRDGGLMPGYLASAINQTLLLTGALRRGARRRLGETMKWWLDITADGGMQPLAPGYRATLHVRLMHAFVRRRVQSLPQWRTEEWGVPVNQPDMAGTYLVFCMMFLLGARVMGVPVSRREARAVIHFWRYVSWLIGVDERWLIDTEAEGRRLLWHILLCQPEPDASSVALGRALMDEPLQRPYPNLRWLRGHFERERHLSVTRLFVSSRQMHALGLPLRVLPWYPLVSAPTTLAWHIAHRVLPGGKERLVRSGRKAQVDLVNRHFGSEAPEVGHLTMA